MNHKISLNKLLRYDIRGKSHERMKSFLSGRRQQVLMNNMKSKFTEVNKCIAQGIIIDLFLFIFYVNDFPLSLKNYSVTNYVDDINVYIKKNNINELIDRVDLCIQKIIE